MREIDRATDTVAHPTPTPQLLCLRAGYFNSSHQSGSTEAKKKQTADSLFFLIFYCFTEQNEEADQM
jgi:hypothetical protein